MSFSPAEQDIISKFQDARAAVPAGTTTQLQQQIQTLTPGDAANPWYTARDDSKKFYKALKKKFGKQLRPAIPDQYTDLNLDPPTGPNPQALTTGFDYVGNYFDILKFLIPAEKRNKAHPNYDPDYNYADLDNATFKTTAIASKPGYKHSKYGPSVVKTIPAKTATEDHDDYMKKLFQAGILVFTDKMQSDRGLKKAIKLRKSIQSIYKIVMKLDRYSDLSDVSRLQQSTLEEYALTTRKMFYILTFLKDQMKAVEDQDGIIGDLINSIGEQSAAFEGLLGRKNLNQFLNKANRLKQDRKALEHLTNFTSDSILRRFKNLGISVDGITTLQGPIPQESNDLIRWNKFKDLFNNSTAYDAEMKKIRTEYINAIQGRGERINLLFNLPLPNGITTLAGLSPQERDEYISLLE